MGTVRPWSGTFVPRIAIGMPRGALKFSELSLAIAGPPGHPRPVQRSPP